MESCKINPQMMGPEPIAIVGSACRFAGGANSPSKLWNLLCNPRDVLSRIPPARFNPKGFYQGSTVVDKAYLLAEDCSVFDHAFFGIRAQEAESMDPQQRMLLEVVYEGLESAGYTIQQLQGSPTAVYVGQINTDYYDIMARDLDNPPEHMATSTARSITSNRISYVFNWTGPSVTIDTACSSSMVAVQQAAQTLRNGDSTMAIAAGTNLLLGPEQFVFESKLRMLSPTARCSMWDASADGYARGEGIAVVVLKTLSRAIADGDIIECIIREIKVNQDGRTMGITMPSDKSQAALIRSTYESCGLDPSSQHDRCQYFEAHGTGTPAGDPVEARAVQSVFFPNKESEDVGSLVVGSIKTLVGHTEGTAGLASLLKASLAVQHGIIPANLHFNRLSPAVEPYCQHLVIPTTSLKWPDHPKNTPRRVSVNSFGFGGTNSHAIIESWHARSHAGPTNLSSTACVVPYGPAVVSSNSARSLIVAVSSILEFVKKKDDSRLADILWTLQTRRSEHPFKASFGALSKDMLIQKLGDWLTSHSVSSTIQPVPVVIPESSRSVPSIFAVFTGQGAQWPRMGAKLLKASQTFLNTFRSLDRALATLDDPPPWSLQAELEASEKETRLHHAAIAQPVCTAVQIALADLLFAAGVKISKVVGHSSGEIAAAYVAGYLTSSDAIRISYYRGLCVSRAAPTRKLGGMLATEMSLSDAEAFCKNSKFTGRLAVAASNSPTSVTLSGDTDAVEDAIKTLTGDKNLFARQLKVDTAYHSHHMLDCASDYRECLDRCNIDVKMPGSIGACTWYSSVTPGRDVDRATLRNSYWVDNLISPVLFSQALEAAFPVKRRSLTKETVIGIEVGPHPALKKPVIDTLGQLDIEIRYSGVLRRGSDDMEVFTEALGFLWAQCLPASSIVDFDGFRRACVEKNQYQKQDGGPRLCKDVPTYSWDHGKSLWRESRLSRSLRLRGPPHPLLGTSTDLSSLSNSKAAHWRNIMRLEDLDWLRGHQFQGQVLFPAAGYISMAVDACHALADTKAMWLLELEHAVLHRPLILDDNTPGVEVLSEIRVLNHDEHHISAEFMCRSLPVNNTLTSETEAVLQNFTCQARLTLKQGNVDSSTALPPRASHQFSLSKVELTGFYSSIARAGLDYTGNFRAQAVHRSSEGVSTVNFTRSYADMIRIHPATIDVASHGVLCALPSAKEGDSSVVYLPKTIDHVRVDIRRLSEIQASQTIVHSKRTDTMAADCYLRDYSADNIHCDVEIFCAQDEHPEIQIEGLNCSRFGASSGPDQDRILYSRTEWRKDIACNTNTDDGSDIDKSVANQHKEIADLANRATYFYLRKLRDDMASHKESKASIALEPRLQSWMDWAIYDALPQMESGDMGLLRMEAWSRDTPETVLGLQARNPESADLKTIIAIGEALPEFLHGELIPLQFLARNEIHALVSQTGAISLARARHLLAEAVSQAAHRYPHMSIIEINAGTGTGATVILEHLTVGTSVTYTVSNPSAESLDEAQTHLRTNDQTRFRILDIERDLNGQGHKEGSYDMVVVTSDALSGMSSPGTAMLNCRRLLRPGGFLLLLARTNMQSTYAQFISSFTQVRRWQHDYASAESVAPMSEARWHNMLLAAGFSGVDTVVRDLKTDEEYYNYSFIKSQAIEERVSVLRNPLSSSSVAYITTTAPKQLPHVMIIGADSLPISKVAHSLKQLLRPFAAGIVFIDSFDSTPQFFPQETCVICLSELDKSIFQRMTPSRFRILQNIMCKTTHLLWLTRQGDTDPYSNMAVGIARSVMMESPGRPMLFVRTERGIPDPNWLAISFLRMTLLGRADFEKANILWSNETEIAINGAGCELIPRIIPDVALNERLNARHRLNMKTRIPGSTQLRLAFAKKNESYEIWEKPEILPPEARSSVTTQVDVVVSFSSPFPFKIQNTPNPHFILMGVERISGHHVLAISPDNSSHITVSPESIWHVDQSAQHGTPSVLQGLLRHILAESIAFNSQGDLWVHGADPVFVEMMRIVAERVGVQIFFSFSAETSNIPGTVFIHPQSTSRRLRQIAPEGVRVYVNLCGRKKNHAPLDALIRTVLGDTSKSRKVPTLDEGEWPVINLEYNLSHLYYTVENYLGQLSSESITCRDTDARVLPLAAILENPESFNLFDVLDWSGPEPIPAKITTLDASMLFSATKTYLLAGLTGDLGLSLCSWMASKGARYFVLGSRNPLVPEETIAGFERRNVHIKVLSMDLCEKASLEAARRTIEASGIPTIGGVVNGAMVLRDKVFENMSLNEFLDALAPKVQGTRNLDQVFGRGLDFFVLFSSLSSVIGIPGLANYGAANAFIHTFAQQRRKRGLPASVLDISVLTDHGYVARSNKHDAADMTRRHNTLPLSEVDFHSMFAEAVYAGCRNLDLDAQISTGIGIWNISSHGNSTDKQDLMPGWYTQPRLSHYLRIRDENHPISVSDLGLHGTERSTEGNIRKQLESSHDALTTLTTLTAHVIRKLERLLQMQNGSVDAQMPMMKLGADSLVATQLRSWIATEFDVKLPALKILASPSVGAMCKDVLSEMTDLPCMKDREELFPNGNNASDADNHYSQDPLIPKAAVASPVDAVPAIDTKLDMSNERSVVIEGHEYETSSDDLWSLEESCEHDSERAASEAQYVRIGQMSDGQSRLFLLHKYLDDKSTYNCGIVGRVHGLLNFDKLSNALRKISEKHESLRSSFFMDNQQGQFWQGVNNSANFILEHHKIEDAGMREDKLKKFYDFRKHAFDVERGQVLRVDVLSLSATEHVLMIIYHHLIMDGMSLVTFIRELAAAYSGMTLGRAQLQGIELAARQRHACSLETLQNEMQHWKAIYPEPPSVLPLFPFSKIKSRVPLDSYDSYNFEVKLDSSFANRVRVACNEIGATSFHFYTAALAAFLSQWVGVSDLSIGIVDANRRGAIDADEADDSDAMGYFLNLLGLRLEVDRNTRFNDLVAQTRDKTFSALVNSTTPFQTVIDNLHIPRDATCHPLFQVAVNYRTGHPSSSSDLGDGCFVEWDKTIVARNAFDLHLDVTEFREGGVWISLFLQTCLYEQSDAETLAQSFVYALEQLTAPGSDHMKVRDCPTVHEADIQRAIQLGRGPVMSLDSWPATLVDRVDEIAALYPNDMAIKETGSDDGRPGRQLSYFDTMRRSTQIANSLLHYGVGQASFVGVYMAPTAETLCTMLAIWRIGAVYIPLDTENPKERLGLMVGDSRPKVIVSRGIHAEIVTKLCLEAPDDCKMLDIDTITWSGPEKTSLQRRILQGDQPACVLFTSGSTGSPKGVVLTHRNLVNQIRVIGTTMNVGRETVLQQSPLGFDPSLEQIFGGLAYGGTVILVLDSARRDSVAIADIIVREKVTYTVAVPSEYASLLRYGSTALAQCGHTWRLAVSGGEKLRVQLLREFARIDLPALLLINAYGPTEGTVSCTRGIIDYRSAVEDADMGRALPNYIVLILDPKTGNPMPVGFPGEIYIGGDGVAMGYLNRSNETQARFLSSSTLGVGLRRHKTVLYRTGDAGRISKDGTLHSLGRIEGDRQVKLRGMRIEIDEVASAMERSSGAAVSDVALSLRDNGLLVAFVVFSDRFEGDQAEFLDQLVVKLPLPVYMRPAVTIPIDSLPMMQNGKRDQRAIDSLPVRSKSRQSANKSHPFENGGGTQDTHDNLTALEVGIKEAWEEVLPEDRGVITGRNSDFFGVGGNSLLLLRLQSVLETTFGIRLLLPKLFQASTLGGLAGIINDQLERTQSSTGPSATINWQGEVAALTDQLHSSSSAAFKNDAKSLNGNSSAGFKTHKGLSVLLTGATGFVGTSILQRLVDDPKVYEVHCVAIRPDRHGRPRNITRVQGPAATNSMIIEHSGDLNDRYLGLSRIEFNNLAATVDVIIHCGADVSLLKTYASLRRANVLSSRGLVEMVLKAGPSRRVPLHFVSTASVACFAQRSRPPPALEDQAHGIDHLLAFALPPISVSAHPPTSEDAIVQGYRCSKWASEALLERAVTENPSAGLTVFVHRPTSILGSGASDTDALGSIVRVSAQLRAAPLLDATVDGVLDLVDVEDVATGIVSCAMESALPGADGTGTGKNLAAPLANASTIRFIHHCSPEKLHMAHLGRYLSKRLGYHVEECDHAEWLERAKGQDMGSLMSSFLTEWEKRDAQKILFPVVVSQ